MAVEMATGAGGRSLLHLCLGLSIVTYQVGLLTVPGTQSCGNRDVCKEPGTGPATEELWVRGAHRPNHSHFPGGAAPRDAAWGELGSQSAGGLVWGSQLLAPWPGLEFPRRM